MSIKTGATPVQEILIEIAQMFSQRASADGPVREILVRCHRTGPPPGNFLRHVAWRCQRCAQYGNTE